jgi:hypothetical protein
MSLDDVKVWCVVCGDEVPLERKRRRSITCRKECATERNRYLRKRADAKKCRFCGQPCTDEEKASYRAWRKAMRVTPKEVHNEDARS